MKSSVATALRLGSFSILWQPRGVMICGLLTALALVLAILVLGSGTLPLTPGEVIGGLLGTGENPTAERIIGRIRLPRLLTALFVGAGLGMAGSIFQSISRNPLGSPDIIGFTTGAATGAIVQIILFRAGPLETSLAAVLAGMGTALLVLLLSMKGHATGGQRLVLVGIGVGAILSAVNTILLVMGDLDQAVSAQLWLAGSLNTRTWSHVVPAALGFAAIVPIALYHARRIDIMEMGDDTASQLGVSVERTRFVMVMAAVGLTAVATAAAGPIAFVALAAPHLAQRLISSPGVPLVSGAMMGAVLLLGADVVSQHLPLRSNIPIGLATGLVGGGYLLWLLTRRKGTEI